MGRRAPVISVLTLLVSLACLAGSAAASASTFTVDSTGDQTDSNPGDGACETATATCTLRAAIEESNAKPEADAVRFSAGFDGTPGSVISLGSSLPTVTAPLRVEGDAGGRCTGAADVLGPCVGIAGAAGEPALAVDAAPALVSGLAIAGGSVGIELEGGAEGAVLQDDWTGIGLDGASAPNGIGILVGPGAARAEVGGDTPAARNVVGNSTDAGVELRGARDTTVSGNYIGVAPDGETVAPNGTGVAVASVTPAGPNATDDVIGGRLSSAEAQTPACDGPCNVISGSLGSGIDLTGDWPQTFVAIGPTTIAGNYVGLDAAGARGIANAGTGIEVGEALHATIGGPDVARDGNHVNGGTIAISAARPGEDFVPDGAHIEGNQIGLDPAGESLLAPPGEFGILDVPGWEVNKQAAHIVDNRIAMYGGVAISQQGCGAEIRRNNVGVGSGGDPLPGARTGVVLETPPVQSVPCFSSVVQENEIDNSADYGIFVENGGNWLGGNRIDGAGINGIRVTFFATRNKIGENSPASENTISNSGGAAIALPSSESPRENVVGRVSGNGNGGIFIDAGRTGPGSGAPIVEPNSPGSFPFIPNEAPTITDMSATSVSGRGPGGEFHIYAKSGASPGQLGRQLAVVQAEANRHDEWTVPLPTKLKQGQYLAVGVTMPSWEVGIGRATPYWGSSELRIVKVDLKPPVTRIVKRPKRRSHRRTAKFGFRASEKGSTFECRLDGRKFKPCRSPVIYRHLRPGEHVFRVRGTDALGNRAHSPTRWKFRVLR
jgi:CSLREA domain-containing protein